MAGLGTIAPPSGAPLGHHYRVLRRLLAANSEMLDLMADLEADLDYLDPGEPAIARQVMRLLDGSLLLAENLNILTGGAHRALYPAHAGIEQAVLATLRGFPNPASIPLVRPLEEAGADRDREVGGKAANLGRVRAVMPAAVPPGFVLTTAAYRSFLGENRLHGPIRKLFRDLSLVSDRQLFKERTAAIRELIEASPVPARVVEAVRAGVRLVAEDPSRLWAVRSSAVGEDGRMTFAGQFDTVLDVPTDGLVSAYRKVLASRYNDHAVLYRLAGGLAEVDTPMAVLVMPMLDVLAAGVLYTRDPNDVSADRMVVDAVSGVAGAMVRGAAAASSLFARRSRPGEVEAGCLSDAAVGEGVAAPGAFPLAPRDIGGLVELGLRLESHSGHPVDVEWALAHDGSLMVLQCRPLRLVERESPGTEPQDESGSAPVAKGGMTVFPGRAVGRVYVARTVEELLASPDGAILVLRQAGPELAAVLPRVAGVVAEHGNPAGHAAALIREFAVPSLFAFPDAERRLSGYRTLSLDATRRLVFDGAPWPDVRERVRGRTRRVSARVLDNPLRQQVLALNLTNPLAINFRAGACRSVHDVVRYIHEKAVVAMFDLGDDVGRRGEHRVWRLESDIALQLAVLDLGGAVPATASERRAVRPEEIASVPFAALWRGMTLPGVSWAGRTQMSLGGFVSVVASTMTDSRAGVRNVGGRNYLMVAPEYVNLNARLAYHFAMVDAFVSPVAENNFVNFRFRGGGAGEDRRNLRARFLAEALQRSGFDVDRRSDLVTAWMRRFPRAASEEGLAALGALMGCARQLDMLMDDEASVRRFVEHFVRREYGAFA
jgi:pyruvate,water dikinase